MNFLNKSPINFGENIYNVMKFVRILLKLLKKEQKLFQLLKKSLKLFFKFLKYRWNCLKKCKICWNCYKNHSKVGTWKLHRNMEKTVQIVWKNILKVVEISLKLLEKTQYSFHGKPQNQVWKSKKRFAHKSRYKKS